MSAIRPYEPASTHWDTARERDVDAQLDAEERELDSREKLWADCEDLIRRIQERFFSGRDETALRDQFADLLDREKAITERECMTASGLAATEAPKLQAKVDELQARLDGFDGDCYCGATVSEWYDLAVKMQAEADALTEERDRLSRQVELKDGIIDGLRQSLDEIMAERNALVHCLEADHGLKASWDGLRKFWNIEITEERMEARDEVMAELNRLAAEHDVWQRTADDYKECKDALVAERDALQAKLDDFDGDCYCGATVVQWYEHSVLLQRKLDEMEQTHMRLPVDADGVPIHIGDTLLKSTGAPKASYGEVVGVSDDSVWFDAKDGWESNWSNLTRHVRPDTVESLLEEFGRILVPENAQDGLPEFVERYAERIRRACNG